MGGTPARHGDLQIDQDLRYERRAYRLRLVSGAVGLALIAAALLGVFGSGPLAHARVRAGGEVELEFDRFVRLGSPSELEVRFERGEGETNVALSRDYLRAFQIQGYSAEPERVTTLPDRVVFTFAIRPPASVTFDVQPGEVGRQEGQLHGAGGASTTFTQWVLP